MTMATELAVETERNWIGGEWVPAQSGRTFENRNPADRDDLVGVFPESDRRDVDAAVEAAKRAFPGWRDTPAPRRAEVLYAAGEILKRDKEKLARLMTREMGKVLAEARGDVQEAIDMAFLAAGEGRRLFGFTTPSELPNKFAMCVRQPIGVCAFVTPWNFPMAIPAWKGMAALIAENTVVIKPATDTPASVVALARVFEEAGLLPGAWNVVMGSGSEVGDPLVSHPDVKVVSFTGSTEVGRRISVACAPTFKRLHLEMGGKNAILVMEDADVDLAVEGSLWGAFGTTGQRCTASSRLLVHRKVYDSFLQKLVAGAKALRVGNGLEKGVDVGPCVSERQRENVARYVEIGKAEGAKLLCGGEKLSKGALARGWFFAPTVFADANARMRVACEEIFGPVTTVVPIGSLEEGVKIANSVPYGLSGSIYTRDVNKAFTAMREFETGLFYVNSSTIGAEVHLPFGGMKDTGNGHREAGIAGLDVFTEWKSIYVDFSGKLQRAQIDTHGDAD
ncbi:MAG TPA: aldehyde dehydrogenase family protein [Thermoanaerobaculia bacterium]|nr:aldehyde dehydrogenase family protein [Thermoanaerobaculia bacterium]